MGLSSEGGDQLLRMPGIGSFAEAVVRRNTGPASMAPTDVLFDAVKHRAFVTSGLGCLLGGALALVFRPSLYAPYEEGISYLAFANLDFRGAPGYYAGRVVHPFAVRLAALLFHAPIDARAFLWVSAAALIAFFACLGMRYGLDFSRAPAMWLLLAVTPTVIDAYRNYYWHDLFYASVCALFFLVLRANWWAGLPFLPLLYLTRESTVVLVLALVAVTAFRREWAYCFSALAAGLAGMMLEARLVARALPNRHGIPVALLDLLKVPYNLLLNVCGLEFWTNTNADTTPAPVWTRNLPSWLHLGKVHQIGFSGFFWDRPLHTLLILATAFGILPLVAGRAAARGKGGAPFRRLDLAVACVFGALMFVLGPLQGTSPNRYILYGWPVFWLFGVAMIEPVFVDRRGRMKVVVLSVCAAWIPAVVRIAMGEVAHGPESLSGVSRVGLLISLALLIPIYVFGWRLTVPVKATADQRVL